MKLPLRRSLGVAAATMATLGATAVPALASPSLLAHRVNCDRTDYVEIHNNDGRDVLCFADRGFLGVAIFGVNWVESGNNKVNIQFQRNMNNPALESITLEKWKSWNFGHVHKVTRIEIF
ncbi:beta/gamma crystallin domain-containing protein [Streptomyces sp. MMS24-I29]|uniref:beta/gamma crystallin domain-containing protein n=1 Tax=Streptomyces sp. MMS24-I29 TaxID=3351480 RepID=UPI003C7D11A3